MSEMNLAAALACHWQLVKQANQEFNLTAIIDDEEAKVKHYQDCLQILPALEKLTPGSRLLDLGSGAGFPGLVIAAARRDLQVTLLDSTNKKCRFLAETAAAMGLDNVQVLCCRCEEAGQDPQYRAAFDAVTARALAALPVLLEYAMPLLKEGGQLIAMKGAGYSEELAAADNACRVLAARLQQVLTAELDGGDQRALLVLEKAGPTPDKYPRRPGMPSKRPL